MKMKTQNLWDSAKEILKRNLIAPKTYIRKEERSQRKDFSFHFKKPEKEKQVKSKEKRKGKKIKMRIKINERKKTKNNREKLMKN